MFWLAVIGGSLILLHALLVLVLKIRKKSSEKQGSYGALVFPRFEIFLIILVLPCICEASASLVKGTLTDYDFSYATTGFMNSNGIKDFLQK